MWLWGLNRGWLLAVSYIARASRHWLQTTCRRWFVMTSRHCGYTKFVWAQRLDEFTLGLEARKIFVLRRHHSAYVLKRPYCVSADTSPVLLLNPASVQASCDFNETGLCRQTQGCQQVTVYLRCSWCSAVMLGVSSKLGLSLRCHSKEFSKHAHARFESKWSALCLGFW